MLTLRLVLIALFLAAVCLSSVSRAQTAPAPPEIVTRAAWGAKPADASLMAGQTPKAIVVHHTSSKQQPRLTLEKKLLNLQSFSQKPGRVENRPKKTWGDVPYHFYIDGSGRIGEGRDIRYAGDTNTGYDTKDKIQIVLEGNFEQERPSEAQLRSLTQLLDWLTSSYGIARNEIYGHGDLAATDCPGASLKPFIAGYKGGGAGKSQTP